MVRVLFKDGPLPPQGRNVATPCDKVSNSESIISHYTDRIKSSNKGSLTERKQEPSAES